MYVSVAVCTYNGEQFIGEQLESIVQQTRRPDEIVICDDGSADNTWEIVQRFAMGASGVVRVYRNRKNCGVNGNFARAISRCEGDVIFLADQDDYWYETKVERVVDKFKAPEVQMVFSDGEVMDERGAPLNYRLWEAMGFSADEQEEWRHRSALDVLLRSSVVTGATMAFRAHIRDRILPIGSAWVHDGWIALMTSVLGQTDFITEPLIRYRQHGGNQVGAPRRFSRARITGALRGRLHNVRREREAWQQALWQLRLGGASRESVAKAEAKVEHLNRRGRLLGRRRARRVVGIVREMAEGGYWKFARGANVAVLDFLA